MDYVRLGGTGLEVSRLCFGCMSYGAPGWSVHPWVLGEADAKPFLHGALDAGINFFDTANYYSFGASEEILGNVLMPARRRDELVIASKVGMFMNQEPNGRGLSRKHIMESIDATLRRLKTDYVDLYYIHRLDGVTPFEETLDALNDVVRAGKVLYLGSSSVWTHEFVQMREHARQQVRLVPAIDTIDPTGDSGPERWRIGGLFDAVGKKGGLDLCFMRSRIPPDKIPDRPLIVDRPR